MGFSEADTIFGKAVLDLWSESLGCRLDVPRETIRENLEEIFHVKQISEMFHVKQLARMEIPLLHSRPTEENFGACDFHCESKGRRR